MMTYSHTSQRLSILLKSWYDGDAADAADDEA